MDVEHTGIGRACWRPRGDELGPADARPVIVPPSLVLDALAHCAGMALPSHPGRRWALAGVDDAAFADADWGETLRLEAVVRNHRDDAATLDVTATGSAGIVCRAKILMAAIRLSGTSPQP